MSIKSNKTNIQNKTRIDDYKPNFSFQWVFTESGVDSQFHSDAEYLNYLESSYVSNSNSRL